MECIPECWPPGLNPVLPAVTLPIAPRKLLFVNLRVLFLNVVVSSSSSAAFLVLVLLPFLFIGGCPPLSILRDLVLFEVLLVVFMAMTTSPPALAADPCACYCPLLPLLGGLFVVAFGLPADDKDVVIILGVLVVEFPLRLTELGFPYPPGLLLLDPA